MSLFDGRVRKDNAGLFTVEAADGALLCCRAATRLRNGGQGVKPATLSAARTTATAPALSPRSCRAGTTSSVRRSATSICWSSPFRRRRRPRRCITSTNRPRSPRSTARTAASPSPSTIPKPTARRPSCSSACIHRRAARWSSPPPRRGRAWTRCGAGWKGA